MTEFIFVRHGITRGLEERILHGGTESPLSELGVKQAQLTAKSLAGCGADKLYSSPLSRALDTAKAIGQAAGLEPVALDGLREMHFGRLEGMRDPWPWIRKRWLLVRLYTGLRMLISQFTGEKPQHFKKRIIRTWHELRQAAPEGRVIVVGHYNVLRTILKDIFRDGQMDPKKLILLPCSISQVAFKSDGQAEAIRINDISHLNGSVSHGH
jgi:broad specificity phosphatase PhoE